MSERFSSDFLRSLRNDIPIDQLIRMSSELPWKEREGFLRFLCPLCHEFHTATNPKTNLARCFRCRRNFNPIDLVMAVEACRFVDAVKILAPLLKAGAGGPRTGGRRDALSESGEEKLHQAASGGESQRPRFIRKDKHWR